MADEMTLEQALAALDSKNVDEKIRAINLLGQLKHYPSVALLTKLASHPDEQPEVVLAVVNALANIASDGAILFLYTYLKRGDPSPILVGGMDFEENISSDSTKYLISPEILRDAVIKALQQIATPLALDMLAEWQAEQGEIAAPSDNKKSETAKSSSPLSPMPAPGAEAPPPPADDKPTAPESSYDGKHRSRAPVPSAPSTPTPAPPSQARPAPPPMAPPPPKPVTPKRDEAPPMPALEEARGGGAVDLDDENILPSVIEAEEAEPAEDDEAGEVANEPVPAEKAEKPGAAPVMFSAYPPKVAKKDEWQPLLAYVFRETAAQAVIADALKQLGEKHPRYSQVTTLGKKMISEGAEIVARPTMAGFQFKPLEVKIGFYDDWQRFNFELRAKDAPLNQFSTGSMTFTVEGLIVADVPLSVFVGEESATGEISSTVTRMYQSIFCSYSHDDTKIVERVERAYKALGLDYLRDITTLKSGTEWSEELLKLIDRADIFQLFWSPAAAESPYVEKEWRHALQLDRDSSRFIRPVYWQQPIPSVPTALRHLHFAYQPDLDD